MAEIRVEAKGEKDELALLTLLTQDPVEVLTLIDGPASTEVEVYIVGPPIDEALIPREALIL